VASAAAAAVAVAVVGEQDMHSSGGSHTVPLLSVGNGGTGRKAELSDVNRSAISS
jgi:hypothetical protein